MAFHFLFKLHKCSSSIWRCRLKRPAYEEEMHRQIKGANVLSTQLSPCDPKFKAKKNTSNVLFIRMNGKKDFQTWLQVAKCLKVWDLDARGFHRGMWRVVYKKVAPLFIVGVPFSDYSWVDYQSGDKINPIYLFSKYLPANVKPLFLEKSPPQAAAAAAASSVPKQKSSSIVKP